MCEGEKELGEETVLGALFFLVQCAAGVAGQEEEAFVCESWACGATVDAIVEGNFSHTFFFFYFVYSFLPFLPREVDGGRMRWRRRDRRRRGVGWSNASRQRGQWGTLLFFPGNKEEQVRENLSFRDHV